MLSEPIRFLLNGEPVAVEGISPQTTLLEWLRGDRGLTGTKEGCAEGDCGACTVVLAEACGGALAWKPVNACIRLMPTVDGKAVFTIESLRSGNALHPVQQALVESHGSQCGFCTPGFAMSLFGLYKNAYRPGLEAIDDALSGNLCRCTGYRPIKAAAQRMYGLDAPDGWRAPGIAPDGSRRVSVEEERLAYDLAALAREETLRFEGRGQCAYVPRDVDALCTLRADEPSAKIVAGATDVALMATKQHRDLGTLIFTTEARELRDIRRTDEAIEIGAAVSLTDAFAATLDDYPELAEAWQRFGSLPIRNAGTLGGNVANGSPIGDSMPVLIALGSSVLVRRAGGRRELPLESFYLGYRKTALEPDEIVDTIRIPRRPDGLILRAYKVGKRFDQDISSVFATFALVLHGRGIASARIGCGGVAPVPARARRTEAILTGRAWDAQTAQEAARALAQEFDPITDMRASAAYRRRALGNLLLRAWHETASGDSCVTRVGALSAHSS